MLKVCVLGLGYIGLPTAAVLASRQTRVHGVDIDQRVIDVVNSGRVHISEPDLDGLVQRVVTDGMLTAHLEPVPSDYFVIAVPTPLDAARKPDLTYVFSATRALAPMLRSGDCVILEATSPIGTTRRVAEILAELRDDLVFPIPGETRRPDIFVAYCPERVLPGRIITELVDNDRVVGGLTRHCAERAARLYESFVRGQIFKTNAETAEMVKLTENSFRDVNIAFANELSLIADRHGIDVWRVIEFANRHPRVNILKPGPGVGGHCIAVDPWFIVDSAPAEARIIRTAREVNDHKAEYVLDKVLAAAAAAPDQPITCFGLAFKANVDDLRESPALEIVEKLGAALPGRVVAVEPNIDHTPPGLVHTNVPMVPLDIALNRTGIYVLLVDHTPFQRIDADRLAGRTLIDTRGIWPVAGRSRNA